MKSPSPLLVKAVELLEDGEWHDYELIVRQIARVYPIGKAARLTEAARARLTPGEPRTRPLSAARQIESGARIKARATLLGSRAFEVDPRRVPAGRRSTGEVSTRRIRMLHVPATVAWLRDAPLRRIGQLITDLRLTEIEKGHEQLTQRVAQMPRGDLEAVARELIHRSSRPALRSLHGALDEKPLDALE